MLVPFYFAEVTYADLNLATVALAYSKWTLGFDDPASRKPRLDLGVDAGWSVEDLLRGEDLTGPNDVAAQTRVDEGLFLLRFRHREPTNPVRLWTNAVEIRQTPEGVTVRHGTAVSGVRPGELPPPVPPRIVRTLLVKAGRRVQPQDLYQPVKEFAEKDAEGLAVFVLLNSQRKLPVIVVTPNVNDGLVRPGALARQLTGLAAVYSALDNLAVRGLNDALSAGGLDRRCGVGNGAVRLYWPALTAFSDPFAHPLWTAERLRLASPISSLVTDCLARHLVQRIVVRTTPDDHFQLIELQDRRQRQSALVAHRDAGQANEAIRISGERSAQLNEALAENRRAYDALDRAWSEHDEKVKKLQEDHRDQVAEAELRAEQLEQELSVAQNTNAQTQAHATTLEAALNARNQESGPTLSEEALVAFRRRLGQRYTVSDALVAIKFVYHDRVTVLPSALASSKRSADFEWPAQAADLLAQLAGAFVDALLAGKPDGEAKMRSTVINSRRQRRF